MPITPLPTPAPNRATQNPQEFSDAANSLAEALPTLVNEINEAITGLTFTTSIPQWVATTTYAIGNPVYSPMTFLAYRAKVAITGNAANTDPSVDTTRWAQVTGTGNVSNGGPASLSALTVTGATSLQAVTASNVTLTGTLTAASISGAATASAADITGTNTTASGTTGTATITVASATGVAVGQTVTGTGIPIGTTVTAVSGTSVTLSANLTATISTQPVTFYSNSKAVTPGAIGSQVCRAWVNFNGIGTVTIRAAFNVSSITDNGVGDYTINFATPMVDENYIVTLGSGGGTPSLSVASGGAATRARTVNSVPVGSFGYNSGTSNDISQYNVAIFR